MQNDKEILWDHIHWHLKVSEWSRGDGLEEYNNREATFALYEYLLGYRQLTEYSSDPHIAWLGIVEWEVELAPYSDLY